MVEVFAMKYGDPHWQATIEFADKSSWSAGPYLANMMRENRFLDWERVFVAYEDGEPVGYCNLTAKDEMPDKYDYTPLIGFVYVDEAHRGHRISQKIIEAATAYAASIGYPNIYLMSGEVGLYEKYGFTKVGDFDTVWGTVDQLFTKKTRD